MKEVRYRLRNATVSNAIERRQLPVSSATTSQKAAIFRDHPLKYRRSASGKPCIRSIVSLVLSVSLICLVLMLRPARESAWSWLFQRLLSWHRTVVPSEPNTTMALLYPPGLLGGYRNQVLRLMGWVSYAVVHNFSYLYLPSVLWSTQMQHLEGQPWYPIPMELMFDIDYWNRYQFRKVLPQLVRGIHRSDCWVGDLDPRTVSNWSLLHPIQRASLLQGALEPVANITRSSIAGTSSINPRRIDLLSRVGHCRHPVVYGGGTGAGRLWNDYISYRKKKATDQRLPKDVDHFILRALRPAGRWRKLAEECVAAKHGADYLALHARVEVEMMAHNCGTEMNWNLTDIFRQVTEFLSNRQSDNIGGVFLAVSRDGMHANVSEGPRRKYKPYADENLDTLNRLVGDRKTKGDGLFGGKVTVFECGKHMMDQYYASHPEEMHYGSLVEQVINFYIAASARVFVGVKHSSYSTDVWTTRYFMGLGSYNFEYTLDGGIRHIENGGLPEPHGNCARRKRNSKNAMKANQ